MRWKCSFTGMASQFPPSQVLFFNFLNFFIYLLCHLIVNSNIWNSVLNFINEQIVIMEVDGNRTNLGAAHWKQRLNHQEHELWLCFTQWSCHTMRIVLQSTMAALELNLRISESPNVYSLTAWISAWPFVSSFLWAQKAHWSLRRIVTRRIRCVHLLASRNKPLSQFGQASSCQVNYLSEPANSDSN